VLWQSVLISVAVTFIVLLVAYPVAYQLAVMNGRWAIILFAVILLPFWTSYLVRVLSWLFILLERGALNYVLGFFGAGPLSLLFTPAGVVLSIAYSMLPFAILPMYVSLRSQERSWTEAALVLGASRTHALREVTLPLSVPGIVAALTIMLVSAFANFLGPAIIGGSRFPMIANTVYDLMLGVQDQPYASALIVVMLVVSVIVVWTSSTLVRRIR
jgi:ABC-type spermidine/putrescine transport system permease subunit I